LIRGLQGNPAEELVAAGQVVIQSPEVLIGGNRQRDVSRHVVRQNVSLLKIRQRYVFVHHVQRARTDPRGWKNVIGKWRSGQRIKDSNGGAEWPACGGIGCGR